MQEGDVLGQDLRLDDQRVVQWHYFDDIAARLDHPANGVHQHLLDDTAYRRSDQGAVHPVVQCLAGSRGLVQLGARFVQLGQRFTAELAAGLFDLALHFADGRLGTRDRQRGGIQLAAVLHLGTTQAQHFNLGDCAGGHQWLGHADLFAQQFQAAGVLGTFRTVFAQFLLALYQLLLQATNFVLQLLAPALVQRLFTGRLAWRGLAQRLVDLQRAVLDLGTQALDAQGHGQAVGLGFTHVGGEAGFIQAQQWLAHFDDLPFLGEDLGDDAALQVLDLLHLGRRNGLAFPPRNFVDGRDAGPHDQEHEEQDHAPYGQPHDPRRILDQGLVDLRQRLTAQ
ncbi:hypothetical protein D3C78_746520 [compost metagenome]